MIAVNEFKVRFFKKYDHPVLLEEEMEKWLNDLHQGGWAVDIKNVHVRRDDGSTMLIAKRWRRENENMPVRSDKDEFASGEELADIV